MRRAVLIVALAFASVAPAFADPEPQDTQESQDSQDEPPALRPSGFWGTTQHAKNGAYRYRMMLVGAGVALLTGVLLWRLVRNANAARATTLAAARTVKRTERDPH